MVVSPAEEAGSEIWPHQSNNGSFVDPFQRLLPWELTCPLKRCCFNIDFQGHVSSPGSILLIPPTLLQKMVPMVLGETGMNSWKKASMKYTLPPLQHYGAILGLQFMLESIPIPKPITWEASGASRSFTPPGNLSDFRKSISNDPTLKNRWFWINPTFKRQIICYGHGLAKPPQRLRKTPK